MEEQKIKELLESAVKEKKTIMETLIGIFTLIVVLLGIIFRAQIIEYLKKEEKPLTPPFEPIPEPIPEPSNVVSLTIPTEQDATTQYLREQFKEDDTIYQFPEGSYFTLGKLPTDPTREFHFKSEYNNNGEVVPIDQMVYIQRGEHGIVLLENRSKVTLSGNNTELWNDRPAVWDGDLNGDGITDGGYPREGAYMSQRKFFKVLNSQYIKIKYLSVRSGNLKPVHKNNRPEYDSQYEFEHAIDVRNSNFVVIEDFKGKGLWGDGVYIRDTYDVYCKNVTIDWNGRQGGAMISGGRAYFEKYNVLNSRRSGFDIEGNIASNDSKDFVVTYSSFDTHLYGLPMGGAGLVENVLCINNIYTGSGTSMYSRGDGNTRLRKNIMYVRNKSANGGFYKHTENILIDGVQVHNWDVDDKVASFEDCYGLIVIRNLKRSEGYEGENKFVVTLSGITTPEMFRIYNNEASVYFQYPDGRLELAEEHIPTEEEAIAIPFETTPWMEMQWNRLYKNGFGWNPDNYQDDGWRPDWSKELKN